MKGTILCDFPPKPGNPRNSEGSFGKLSNGQLLFVFSRFHGGNADDAAADLCLLVSDDDGHTWTDKGILFSTSEAEALNLMSITLLTMNNGDLGLFYLIRKTDFQMQAFMRRTTDGIHWSDPVVCIPQDEPMTQFHLPHVFFVPPPKMDDCYIQQKQLRPYEDIRQALLSPFSHTPSEPKLLQNLIELLYFSLIPDSNLHWIPQYR